MNTINGNNPYEPPINPSQGSNGHGSTGNSGSDAQPRTSQQIPNQSYQSSTYNSDQATSSSPRQPSHSQQPVTQQGQSAGYQSTRPQQPVAPSQQTAGYQAASSSGSSKSYGAQQSPINAHAQHTNHGYHQTVQPAYQTPSAGKQEKSGGSGGKTFLLGFLGAAVALVIGFSGFGIYNASSGNSGSSGSSTVLGATSPTEINIEEDDTLAEVVAAKALPSVVNINVYTTQSSSGLFGYGGSDGSLTESSLGSGVILSEDGYIITNYHVIEGSEVLEVTIGDDTYQAEVVGSDPSSDIAVIKAQGASGLTPIEIGSSSDLDIGDWVMTIGSPFGLEQSVATGIVSATSRSQIVESMTGGSATVYTNLIQTDAAINPGNSGGALVDANGRLIGINTLITSYSGNYSGVGFAIPVDYALTLAQQIIDGKTPTHAQLGVSLSTVNSSIAQRYGLSVDSGAYITQVYSNSGAAQAGLEVGDIITKFNGVSITSASDLMLEVRSLNPGDTASVEYVRDGQTKTADITLGADSGTQQQSSKQSGHGSNSQTSTGSIA